MITRWICIFVCLGVFVDVSGHESKKTVCLNMIVKDESHVITRSLGNVKPLIDYWVIVDTGSTDGTQEIIREFMQDVPGELHEQPWVNFGHNRNEALKLAKGKADYVLFIDADDQFVYDDEFQWPEFVLDSYLFPIHHSGMVYDRIQLINNALAWEWKGVLHECLACSDPKSEGQIKGIILQYNGDGSRSGDPEKFVRDAAVLEEGVKEEPDNARYRFYLAQSYRDARNLDKALENYEKRIQMGGWDQEVFWSLLQVARLQESLGYPQETVVESYYKAYHYRPSRAEPLYHLSQYYRNKGETMLAYLVAKLGASIPHSEDILFVEKWIYDYDLLLEMAISAYWAGKYEECKMTSVKILRVPNLPANIRACVERNLAFANTKLLESYLGIRS